MLKLRGDAVKWREVEGEGLLLDLKTSSYLAVNPSATLLWRQLEAGTSRGALVETLRHQYELAEDRASADVDAFLDDCRARGFLDEEPD